MISRHNFEILVFQTNVQICLLSLLAFHTLLENQHIHISTRRKMFSLISRTFYQCNQRPKYDPIFIKWRKNTATGSHILPNHGKKVHLTIFKIRNTNVVGERKKNLESSRPVVSFQPHSFHFRCQPSFPGRFSRHFMYNVHMRHLCTIHVCGQAARGVNSTRKGFISCVSQLKIDVEKQKNHKIN